MPLFIASYRGIWLTAFAVVDAETEAEALAICEREGKEDVELKPLPSGDFFEIWNGDY